MILSIIITNIVIAHRSLCWLNPKLVQRHWAVYIHGKWLSVSWRLVKQQTSRQCFLEDHLVLCFDFHGQLENVCTNIWHRATCCVHEVSPNVV